MKPFVKTDKTPTSIVGNNGYLLEQVYKGEKTSKSDKQLAGEIFGELRRHGFYPNIYKKKELEYVQIMTGDHNQQADLREDHRTPLLVGKKRMSIIQKLLDHEITREDAEYYQGLPDSKLLEVLL